MDSKKNTKVGVRKKVVDTKVVKKVGVGKKSVKSVPAMKKSDLNVKRTVLRKAEEKKTDEKVVGSVSGYEVNAKKSGENGNGYWPLITVGLGLVALLVFAQVRFGVFNGVVNYLNTSFVRQDGEGGEVKVLSDDEVVKIEDKFEFGIKVVYDTSDTRQNDLVRLYIDNIENNLKDIDVSLTEIDKNSDEGLALIGRIKPKFLPVFIADENFKNYSKFEDLRPFISMKDNLIVINSEPVEFIEFPEVGNARILGANFGGAKTKIISYMSMTCPYCAKMDENFLKLIGENKNVSVAFKQFDRGGNDIVLSQFAECSADQGKFKEAVGYLFAEQGNLFSVASQDELKEMVGEGLVGVGIDKKKVLACVNSGKYKQKINDDTQEALSFGINGTPSFFVNEKFVGSFLEYDELLKTVESN